MKKKKLLKEIERLRLELKSEHKKYERALFDDDADSRKMERLRFNSQKELELMFLKALTFGNITDFGNGKGCSDYCKPSKFICFRLKYYYDGY